MEVYLGLGSNLGDREQNLFNAIEALKVNSEIRFIKKSSYYENPAIEEAGPENFLNAVIKIDTSLDPYQLLKFINKVEAEIDPEREHRGRKKARFIDIDILLFGDLNIKDKDLVIPHPRMNQRDFVKKPLDEILVSDYAEDIEARVDEKLNLKIYNRLNSISDFLIRRMYLTDLDQVMEIDRNAFGERHWSRNIFLQELANEKSLYLAVENISPEDQSIIGFAGANFVVDEMHILTISAHQDHRRKKIAESLLLALIDTALRSEVNIVTLEVKFDNQAAINLYTKFGFEYCGKRERYYEDGTDAAIYTLEIKNFKL